MTMRKSAVSPPQHDYRVLGGMRPSGAAAKAQAALARVARVAPRTALQKALTHDADCPARDKCECGAEGYGEWAAALALAQPVPAPTLNVETLARNAHHCCSGCDATGHCTHGYESRAALDETRRER